MQRVVDLAKDPPHVTSSYLTVTDLTVGANLRAQLAASRPAATFAEWLPRYQKSL